MAEFVELNGYAKVNLSLGISGREEDFHNLDSVMVTVDLCDKVSMRLRNDREIAISYLGGESYPVDNAYKAARACMDKYGFAGADIVISKGVPSGVGVGGSAVDAAAVVRGYERLCGVTVDDEEFLLSLGGDVPFLKRLGAATVKGRGEIIIPIELPELYIVLCYGSVSLSTKEVFALYDKIGGENGTSDSFLSDYKPFNALERSAVRIEPSISRYRSLLKEAGFESVVMTGAGSGFIAYERDKEAFERKFELARSLASRDINLKILKPVKE